MYQREGKAAYKADLENTWKLMDRLNHPYKGFKSIHVAGTNGKGSVSHMLAAILQTSGYKVGLYTSPHLKDFRERIRINGDMISEHAVIKFVEEHRDDFETIGLSFFEWTVGLAFTHYSRQKVDIAVIEVGMGGRLDSTNVIIPELSIITNIGMDHTQFLGDTLAKIAYEKAGIIKENTPVVVGQYLPETKPVFDEISEKNNSPILYAQDLIYSHALSSDLKGKYQDENVQTVRASVPLIREKGFEITDEDLAKGLKNVSKLTGIKGRWQLLQNEPMVICDTAHNLEGLSYIVKQLGSIKRNKLRIVFGMVNDKEVHRVIGLLPQDATYYFCKPDIQRGMDARILSTQAAEFGLTGRDYNSVNEAFQEALKSANKEDLIYVGGSTFVVAEVL